MKYLLILTLILWGCSPDAPSSQTGSTASTAPPAAKTRQQLNLTILLDLSDRIDPEKNPAHPEHFRRDSALISYLADYFLSEMRAKGTHMSKGKMRLVFTPNPPDPGINLAAQRLHTDLSGMDTKQKKTTYETLGKTVAENISNIYKTTINQAQWPGSDIWRFFKNDVKEIAIDKDTGYRNILVIFTDGYIYHDDSKDNEGNRYAYVLPELFDKYHLRNNNRWAEQMDKLDFGLISRQPDLSQLEILMLEVSPSPGHKNDEDIIRKVMNKWFSEMKVKKWKILNSDLPELTKQKMENFLQE
ncbi:hypothetical protein [Chitinophaga japonensis]|uniref:VWFA domain-containing protein n=1 Tax=Chitinophaga japonensis TaxID=104662 RepID=A0A562T3W9_CHIJA|nr:hypothetical protein [Chitinophaga japonensis]TWI88063.1 hypothetical protein LX66_2137 [Chitinophaga japonensis]